MSNNSRLKMGQRIALLRKERNLSQNVAAKKLNISSSTLSMYETGNREPNNEILSKLADFFGVSADYLLGRELPDNSGLTWRDLGQLIIKNKSQVINIYLLAIDFVQVKNSKYGNS